MGSRDMDQTEPTVATMDASGSPDGAVHVFVTGFGRFRDTPGPNPSWEMVKRLPATLPPSPKCPHKIRIWTLADAQSVVYEAVDELYRNLCSSKVVYGAVLHCGVDSSRQHFAIEKVAHRDGYQAADAQGKQPNPATQPEFFNSGPPTLETGLKLDDVLKHWEGDVDSQPVESHNAGRYLCEYILYSALATFEAPGGPLAEEKTVVTFLHVPAQTDEASLQKGQALIEALIKTMVCVRFERGKR